MSIWQHGKAQDVDDLDEPQIQIATAHVRPSGRKVTRTKTIKPSATEVPPSIPAAPSPAPATVPDATSGDQSMPFNEEEYGAPPNKQSKNQNDYLRDFEQMKSKFVVSLLSRYEGPISDACIKCHGAHRARFRCRSCFASAPACRRCIRNAHIDNPFHRIERWTGEFWEKAALWQTGLRLVVPSRRGCEECISFTALDNVEAPNDKRYRIIATNQTVRKAGSTRSRDAQANMPRNANVAPARESVPTNMSHLDPDFVMGDKDDYPETMTVPPSSTEPLVSDSNVGDGITRSMATDADFAMADNEDYPSDEDGTVVGQDEEAEPLELNLADCEDDPGDTECLEDEPGDRLGKGIPTSDILGNQFITIVDASGLHHLPLVLCRCHLPEEQVLDCVAAGLLPTSYIKISTVFTEQCLDEARLANLEAKTTPYQYYHYLRRLTNPAFPAAVSERYAELRRMMREWRIMKREMWAGTHLAHPPEDGSDGGTSLPAPSSASADTTMADTAQPPSDAAPPATVESETSKRPPSAMNGIGLDTTGKGILSLFCPACPQWGVNLHRDSANMPEAHRFALVPDFTTDGNFSADHIKQKKTFDDVSLLHGRGMLTPQEPFKTFAKLANSRPEEKTGAACEHNFRAITQATKARSDCDVTGICGVACARHGCFVPGGVNNLEKGERQLNIDWAVVEAMWNAHVGPDWDVHLWYDIFCQWSVNFKKRLAGSNDMLELPPGVNIHGGIGLFHVHGHEDKCFRRFASYFIPGAAIVDGEVLETLWSVLNLISRSTRTATLSHREEILDDHMNDSNWKKLVGIVPRLVKKFKTAVTESADTAAYFKGVSDSAPAGCVDKWTRDIEDAEAKRKKTNGLSMDILQPKMQKKTETQIDVQIRLIKDFPGNSPATAYLVEGLKLEIEQLKLGIHISRFGVNPSKKDKIDIASLRDGLMKQIVKFHERGLEILGSTVCRHFGGKRPPIPVFQSEGDDAVHVQAADSGVQAEEIADETSETQLDAYAFATEQDTPAERVLIRLPSSLPAEILASYDGKFEALYAQLTASKKDGGQVPIIAPGNSISLEALMVMESELRQGVMNDSLQDIRLAISSMSFQYTGAYRLQKTKAPKTRSRTAIDDIAKGLSHSRRVYDLNRQRVLALGVAESDVLRPIRNADVRVNTSIMKPNVQGNVRGQLSWIFSAAGPESETRTDQEILSEYFRVHRLYARAMKMRWEEEFILVKYEMRWTWIYFTRRSDSWRQVALHGREKSMPAQAATTGMSFYPGPLHLQYTPKIF